MVRPQKKVEDKRDKRLPETRVSAAELAAVKANAAQAGLSLSEYMRQMAMQGHVIVKEPLADVALIRLLKILNNNMNQIARKSHILDEIDVVRLRELISRVSAFLDRLF